MTMIIPFITSHFLKLPDHSHLNNISTYAQSAHFENFMKSRFGVYHGDPTPVKIWFSQDIAGYIKEKIWHASQQIEDQDDGAIIYIAEVAGTDEIKSWILSWGAHARVLAPVALTDEIRSEAEAMLQAYTNIP